MAFWQSRLRDKSIVSKDLANERYSQSRSIAEPEGDLVCIVNYLRKNTKQYFCLTEANHKILLLNLITLDTCVDQLHILSGGIFGGHHLAFFDDILNLQTDTSKSVYDPVYDINTGEPFNVVFRRTQMNKQFVECAKLREFLIAIRNEMRDSNSFQIFRDVIFDVRLKVQEAVTLLKQTQENYDKMAALKNGVITHGLNSRLQLHKANNIYSDVCKSVQHLVMKHMIVLRYAKAYENSRCEQNQIKCERENRELQNIITKYKHKIQLENRVYLEVSRFLNTDQKDLKNSIDNWVNKYNEEMEVRHFQIIQIKERLENMQKHRNDLTILFADHKKSINDFKEYKEKKRIYDEEKQRLINAAIKVQAWWRGNMYRHQLGPYNPNRLAKGKRKKTKKKK